MRFPIQWINDDWPHFGFCSIPALGTGISSPQKVFEVWSEEFAGYYDFGGCYVLTMHPFVIGRPSRIRLLDRLIQYIKSFDGVWWATLEQIARTRAVDGAGSLSPARRLLIRPSVRRLMSLPPGDEDAQTSVSKHPRRLPGAGERDLADLYPLISAAEHQRAGHRR